MKRATHRFAGLGALAALALWACGGTPPSEEQPDAGGQGCVPDAQNLCPDPPVISPNEAGWWRDKVFYEVFVRSFYDSNTDGVGDLKGLTQKLDYLNDGDPSTTTDLGVDALWLMPIFPSPSYHGYDVTDYRSIESDYGTASDFDALISAAHQRGIKVILDMVVNHTSVNHPWFVDSRSGPTAQYRDWYVWRDTPPNPPWHRPWDGSTAIWHAANGSYYYGVYWSGMPDLNWKNPAVEAEFIDVMKYWLGRGADGFRIDAARYLVENGDGKLADQPETHDAFQRIRHAVHEQYPDALFVAEAWTSSKNVAGYYGEGNEFQLAFNFDLAKGILDSVSAGTRNAVVTVNYLSSTAFRDRGFEAPFLSNHDQPRTMRVLGDSVPAAKLAAATLMAMPGTPFLYYGEELGMQGGPQTRDEDKRTPMRWDATAPQYGFTLSGTSWYGAATSEDPGVDVASQQADAGSLWNTYQKLIALRHSSAALSKGEASAPTVTGGGQGVFAVLRTASTGERVLAVFNYAGAGSGAFTVSVVGTPSELLSEGAVTAPTSANGALSFSDLPAQSFTFIRLD